jgi:hypothetical protein
MKTKKNNTKKEQITAQVENQEIVANATEVTNPTSSQEDNSIKENLEAIASGKKNKKSKKDKKTKKAEVIEVPVAKSKKKKDKVVKEVAKKQEASIVEEVVAHRDVKYIYPDDITDTVARKKWRQEVRNKYRALEREMNKFIMDQESKDYKKAKKAFEAYAKEVLKPGMAI